jgi:hypothetical protein
MYNITNKIRLFKSRKMRWSGFLASMGRRRIHAGFLRESQAERDH